MAKFEWLYHRGDEVWCAFAPDDAWLLETARQREVESVRIKAGREQVNLRTYALGYPWTPISAQGVVMRTNSFVYDADAGLYMLRRPGTTGGDASFRVSISVWKGRRHPKLTRLQREYLERPVKGLVLVMASHGTAAAAQAACGTMRALAAQLDLGPTRRDRIEFLVSEQSAPNMTETDGDGVQVDGDGNALPTYDVVGHVLANYPGASLVLLGHGMACHSLVERAQRSQPKRVVAVVFADTDAACGATLPLVLSVPGYNVAGGPTSPVQ